MPDGLYERDALAWAEQQSYLLSRLAAGERLNADVDWEHVIEEVRDVGLSELHKCESLLTQAMIHLLKLHAWPASPAVLHWRGETVNFLGDAQLNFSPSMRQRIDMAKLYGKALRVFRAMDDATERELPEMCPFTVDELLADDAAVADMASRLSAPHTSA